jgi:hypothetical protein
LINLVPASCRSLEDIIEKLTNIDTAQLEAIDTGGTFEVIPRMNGKKCRKRRFRVEKIEGVESSLSQDQRESSYVPYGFDLVTSHVRMATPSFIPVPSKPMEFKFDGLFGLDKQIEQLREHIIVMNEFLDSQKDPDLLDRPSPVLIHGPSGRDLLCYGY